MSTNVFQRQPIPSNQTLSTKRMRVTWVRFLDVHTMTAVGHDLLGCVLFQCSGFSWNFYWQRYAFVEPLLFVTLSRVFSHELMVVVHKQTFIFCKNKIFIGTKYSHRGKLKRRNFTSYLQATPCSTGRASDFRDLVSNSQASNRKFCLILLFILTCSKI